MSGGKKRTDFPIDFYIVAFGENYTRLGHEFFNTVFINPDIHSYISVIK